jgi:hypothetical protein
MRKPQGRVTDILSVGTDKSRSVLMLDRLTYIPEEGDMLQLAGRNLVVEGVDGHRKRDCVTALWFSDLGSISILINERPEELRPLAEHPNRLWVSWLPKAELLWHFKTDDLPTFTRLNEGWNAHPNLAGLSLEQTGNTLVARIKPNPYQYHQYEIVPEISVSFVVCTKYRVTPVNDEGWYMGQCRFSGLAPSWGEFYEISGDSRDDLDPRPWIEMEGCGTRHFHFYMKDETLEVKAEDWLMRHEE